MNTTQNLETEDVGRVASNAGLGVFAYDDGSKFELCGHAGGGHPDGMFATVMCLYTAPDGKETVYNYIRDDSIPSVTNA